MSATASASPQKDVTVPLSLIQALRPHIEQLGINVPGSDRVVPKVNLDLPVREVAMQLGALLKNCGLYRKGADRTLVAQLGEEGWKAMTPHRFCGWVERYVTCCKSYRGQAGSFYDGETSMGKDLAAKILETDDFVEQIPIIDRTVSVRLPVRRKDGTVELLNAGYDKETLLWCDDAVEFDTTWTRQQACDLIEEFCKEFPWADLPVTGWDRAAWQNRSFLVHLCGMVGSYCGLMFEPGTIRPALLITANDQGSGKSLLTAMQLAGPFGIAASTDLPLGQGKLNQEKFTALLETVARSMKPFLLLDDVPGAVFSNALNRFITAPAHSAREYGGNSEMFEVPAVTQVFLTGNNVEITRDIQQRALICELFLKVDAESKKHVTEYTAQWMGRPEQRSRFLSAMWAFVQCWIDAGQEPASAIKQRAPEWSGLVGGILDAALGPGAAAIAFATPDLPFAGDRSTDEMRKLLTALADDVEESYEDWIRAQNEKEDDERELKWPGKSITTSDVVAKARELSILLEVVGTDEDKAPKAPELRKLGRRLEKWRGKEDLVTTKGRKFRFGHRRQEKGTVYPIEWTDVIL